jgi:hypothetical protein
MLPAAASASANETSFLMAASRIATNRRPTPKIDEEFGLLPGVYQRVALCAALVQSAISVDDSW